jgi:hypothetical protein
LTRLATIGYDALIFVALGSELISIFLFLSPAAPWCLRTEGLFSFTPPFFITQEATYAAIKMNIMSPTRNVKNSPLFVSTIVHLNELPQRL